MKAKLLFLGTGGSLGVPMVACSCAVCKSSSPLNKRLRPSILLTVAGKRFLIDTGPDFREQALKYNIDNLDGVLLTHPHYDHISGLDELRVYYFFHDKKVPCLCSKETFREIQERFPYLFRGGEKPDKADMCVQIDFVQLPQDFGKVSFEGIEVEYVSYYQRWTKVSGYRIGAFAYISDIRKYDEAVVEALKGVEVLVVSALRYTSSEVHFSFDEAINFSRKLGAKLTFFTHIAHDIDHEGGSAKLPTGILLGHDGLEIVFDI